MQCKDQTGRVVEMPRTPSRIVSLVPSQTELLVDLGLTDNLVGVTKFCVHPKNIRKKTNVVGGTKTVHFEKIEILSPDIIICNKEENTEEMVSQLQQIAPVWVSDIYNIQDSLDMIAALGKIFKVEKVAESITEEIILELKSFKVYMYDKPIRKAAYLIWKNPYMVAGRSTFVNALLQLNNFENVISDEDSRYPEIELQDLDESDLILLSSEPYPFKEKDVLELKKTLPNEVLLVDGEYFSWYGSRLRKAFYYFKQLH